MGGAGLGPCFEGVFAGVWGRGSVETAQQSLLQAIMLHSVHCIICCPHHYLAYLQVPEFYSNDPCFLVSSCVHCSAAQEALPALSCTVLAALQLERRCVCLQAGTHLPCSNRLHTPPAPSTLEPRS